MGSLNKIKFSHYYQKLPTINEVKLIEVIKTHYKNLSEPFIEYDTKYWDDKLRVKHYKVPETDLLLLIFECGGMIFTTLRRWTPKKEKYYRNQIGKEFEIVFT